MPRRFSAPCVSLLRRSDRLGDRLRRSAPTSDDRRLLDEYRTAFDAAFRSVVARIENDLRVRTTGRGRKTTPSIVEKLRREPKMRLSQMQDIAGCRTVVEDMEDQDAFVVRLQGVFPSSSVVDRRRTPSHGYRAVHVIGEIGGRAVEVQVRTELQHLWAEFSEKIADGIDRDLKYGGGPDHNRRFLEGWAQRVRDCEEMSPGEERDNLRALYAGVLSGMFQGWDEDEE